MRGLSKCSWAVQIAERMEEICIDAFDAVCGALHAASYFGLGYLGVTLVSSWFSRRWR
jgi:hypothetical protein